MIFQLPLCLADAAPDPAPMWSLSLPWWQFIVRAFIVYGFLIFILRISGKRQIGQLAPFDLVLLLVLSNAVQNSMNGGDNSVSGGLLSASALIGANALVGYLTFKSKKIERLVEGQPRVLIHNGKLYPEALRGERMTHHELMCALRTEGCASIEEVRSAILETDGQLTVIPRKK